MSVFLWYLLVFNGADEKVSRADNRAFRRFTDYGDYQSEICFNVLTFSDVG